MCSLTSFSFCLHQSYNLSVDALHPQDLGKVIFWSHMINTCIRLTASGKTSSLGPATENIQRSVRFLREFQHMPLMTMVAAKMYEKN